MWRARRDRSRRPFKVFAATARGGLCLRRLPLPDPARRPRAGERESHHHRLHATADRRGARRRPRQVCHPSPLGPLQPDFAEPAAGRDRDRGRRLLRSRRHRPRRGQGRAREELGGRAVRARRQHHHAAARQEPVPVAVAQPDAQGQRAPDHAPARGCADQAAHPGDLPEHDRMGRRHLRLRSGRARVLRHSRAPACRPTRRRCWPAPSSTRASTAPRSRPGACCGGSRSS